ncbi:MAG: hypothetical protein KF832_01420 [Caldilineaceae bacterium]|nr:hypothetical protein [Caldilineaceae bacterium]
MTESLPPLSERRAIKRARAETYVLTTLVAFAASVIVTRLYLELTGYPQIGRGNLHIAHVLWGGLLLYIAALLPLTLLNRSALLWSALCNGVGIGLFIDEVGKFITRDVDYFYPPAAPIIYAFFLLSVLLYLFVRRPARHNARAELYRALEEVPPLLDGVLLTQEREEILARLAYAQQSSHPPIAALATTLNHHLKAEQGTLAVGAPGLVQRLRHTLARLAARLGQQRHRRIILGLVGLQGFLALQRIFLLALIFWVPSLFSQPLGELLVNDRELGSTADLPWFFTRLGLEIAVGLIALYAFTLLWRDQVAMGIKAAIFGIVLSLTTVVLLTFYLDQFSAITTALFQFALFLFFELYRQLYLSST